MEKARACGACGWNELGLGIAFGAFGRKKLNLWSLRVERVPGVTNKEEELRTKKRSDEQRREVTNKEEDSEKWHYRLHKPAQ